MSFYFHEGLALFCVVLGIVEMRRKHYGVSVAFIGIGLALGTSAALTRFAGL